MAAILPLALTSGDPAGIGAEIAIKCWQQREGLPAFFLLDDPDRISKLVPEVPVVEIELPEEVEHVFPASSTSTVTMYFHFFPFMIYF